MAGGKEIFRRNVSETSLVASELGTPGEYRQENGKMYRLVMATASLSHGAPVQYATATIQTAGTVVQVCADTTMKANGVYNPGTVSCAASTVFWMQYQGVGPVLNGTATLASNKPARGSTVGVLASIATTLDNMSIAFRTIGATTATVTAIMHIFCDA